MNKRFDDIRSELQPFPASASILEVMSAGVVRLAITFNPRDFICFTVYASIDGGVWHARRFTQDLRDAQDFAEQLAIDENCAANAA